MLALLALRLLEILFNILDALDMVFIGILVLIFL